MRAAAIRQELLTSHNSSLDVRRKIMVLSAIGLADFAFLSLYQSGAINRLPELPFKTFDSNKVNADPEAYKLGAPDATISAWLYASTMVLATVGGTEASGRTSKHDILLGGTVAANAAGAVYYLSDMVFSQKKVCPYCIAGAVINIASAVLVAPLVINSVKRLFAKQQ